jgi:hypothetical protein
MKILFDNNGFANLIQKREYAHLFQNLQNLITLRQISVIGCCTLLQELAGLSKINEGLYIETLLAYEQMTQGLILQPADDLIISEGTQKKPRNFHTSLLNANSATNILNKLKAQETAAAIYSEAVGLKQGFGLLMENTHREILSTPSLVNLPFRSVATAFNDWFNVFHAEIQQWFIDMFKEKSDYPVSQLPHVSAFLGYALTRIYEHNVFGSKNRDNDLFDRSYFTDAAVVDVFVTNDNAFYRTAMRVPNRKFEVLKLDELTLLVDQMLIQPAGGRRAT